MKTLGVWIAGIFALGLALGSFVSGSGPGSQPDAVAPPLQQVDCGKGREALLEPIDTDGTTSFRVRCVETGPSRRAHVAVSTPLAPPTPIPQEHIPEVEAADDARSWKQSAVVIGGAAGAGAGIGAVAKGKKGAAVGAAIGAASGTVYELLKRDKNR
jgi:hypothetical protein